MAHASAPWILRSRVMSLLILLGALAAAGGMAFAAATEAPGGDRDLRAYRAAAPCPPGAAVPFEATECRRTQQYTVAAVHLTRKRGELDRTVLTDAHGARWEAAYTSRKPVLQLLSEGDRITGTLWRGRLVEIAAEGETQMTDAGPDDMRARLLIGALLVIPPALVAAAACAWRLARLAADPTPGMAATLALAGGLLVGGIFTPLVLAAGEEERFWPVAAAWLPMAAIMTIAARAYVLRVRETAAGSAAGQPGPRGRLRAGRR
ncbi:hypothetical protein [Actinomadura sp. 21ATH]|uniref:hypothetical protein n=1 Tax=Actinomadura sp. 21ATH TaxID=1735444 RepID=UPI0035C11BE0